MTTPPLPRCHNPHEATTWRHRLLHNIGGGRWACEACWTVGGLLERSEP